MMQILREENMKKNIRKQFPVTVVTNMKRQRRQRRPEGLRVHQCNESGA